MKPPLTARPIRRLCLLTLGVLLTGCPTTGEQKYDLDGDGFEDSQDCAPADALATLQTARDGQPWNPYAHLALAELLVAIGRPEAAAAAFEAVRDLDPELPELRAPGRGSKTN